MKIQNSVDGAALDNMDKVHRTNLVNSLSGYKSVNLLGTMDAQRNTNLSLVSSAFHVGANPPLMGMLMRPHSVPRHSLENLLEQGWYTLNAVTKILFKQAHQTSARYPRDVSEFDATGLTAVFSPEVSAPYVEQSPIQIGLKLLETQTLKVNDTVLVIGEVKQIRLGEGILGVDGQLDLNLASAVAVSGLDEYHLPQALERLSYPKP